MACGGRNTDGNSKTAGSKPAAGKSEITMKIGGQDKKIKPTSSWANHSAKSFSPLVDGKRDMFNTSSTTVILANIELIKNLVSVR